jgi:ABC-type bacteriocin/lantibiotic exporter with double-glycine peptidase domain
MSGGQTQRVGLARALAGNPELLILDEPTSAVDQSSQSRITEFLRDLPAESIVILISHRPEVLQLCSTLLFVKDGVILSEGSPDQLLGTIVLDEEADSGAAFG